MSLYFIGYENEVGNFDLLVKGNTPKSAVSAWLEYFELQNDISVTWPTPQPVSGSDRIAIRNISDAPVSTNGAIAWVSVPTIHALVTEI
jgi:hypothetical protein